jgi:3-phosphoshikimate 1-carboxyvinyltransferase
MGADVEELGEAGRLPVEVRADGSKGGTVTVAGDASSQFLSGLLLAGPATGGGLELAVQGHLVSRPYVDMTVSVMRVFGARVTVGAGGDRWRVEPGGYRPATLAVEPDASAASYFMAAAAIVGGSVRIPGLTRGSLQGDVAFADVLERMGVRVDWSDAGVTVTGTGVLRGIEVDLGDLTDTAQTLAAVAVFAEGPTRVTGIGFIRGKETDRVGHPVAELRRLGIEAEEEADGFVVRPGTPRPGLVETYGDHRMAMAFALLGLRVPGIRIADPACVGKTFPGYWRALEGLSR